MQRTILYQHGCHRTTTTIQLGFNDSTLCLTVRVCPQLLHVCGQQYHFQQIFNADTLLCRDLADDGFTAPFLRYQFIFRQLLQYTIRIGIFLINLIDSNNNRNFGCLRMVDCFNGLRHNAVICCNNQNRNISNLCATGTHGRKCCMTRSIQEGDRTAIYLDTVCTDMLGNAACFTCRYIGLTDAVQQGGLAVVNVTHDNDNRASRLQVFFLVLALVKQLFLDGDKDFLLNLCTHFLCYNGSGIKVNGLGDICHNTQLEQFLDDIGSGALQAGCQLTHIDFIRDHNLQLYLLDLLLLTLQTLELLLLLLTALIGERLAGICLTGDLLLALLHAVRLLRHQCINAVIIAIQIHIAAATGVNTMDLLALGLVLLGHDGRRTLCLNSTLRAQDLALLMGLCRLTLLLAVVIATALLLLCRCSLFLRLFCLLRLLLSGFLFGFRLDGILLAFLSGSLLHRLLADNLGCRRLAFCCLLAQNLFHIFNRMLLCHIIKDQIQLLRLQNLHMVLRCGEVFCHHIGDILCIHAKILGYFMYTVFILNTHARSPPRFA